MHAAPLMSFDHIAVRAASLEVGLAFVRTHLGVDLPAGGAHPLMATHNHLMALGPDTFLEVIAPDPASTAQRSGPRWFDLDRLGKNNPPRLAVVCHSPDINGTLTAARTAGIDLGRPLDLARGNLSWQFIVRDDGAMPMGGVLPQVLSWPEGPHPAGNMADLGWRLTAITLGHPDAQGLIGALEMLGAPPMLAVTENPAPRVSAVLQGPSGQVATLDA